jgi:hypothetical protein
MARDHEPSAETFGKMGFDVIGIITVVVAILGVGVRLEWNSRKLDRKFDRLAGDLADTRVELADTRVEVKSEIVGRCDRLRDELRGEIHGVRDELRGEIHGRHGEVRDEMKSLRGEMRSEIKGLRGEIAELRKEVAGTRTSVARLEGFAFGIPVPEIIGEERAAGS